MRHVNTTAVRLNRMVAWIRREKAVPFGEMCLRLDLAPSTVYQYARTLKNVYLDIKFENGLFYTVQDEKIQQLTGQTKLTEERVCV